jgi:predicted DsbA family dithiol-disulfide isomerase
LNPYYPDQEGQILGFAPDSAYDPTTITQKTNKSRLAQELTKWAESREKGDGFRTALFEALYVQSKDIRDIPMLCALAESVGLSFFEAEKVLKTRAFKDALDADWLRSLEIDPEYVPSVLLNGELLVNPQQYELLKQLMVRHNVTRRR